MIEKKDKNLHEILEQYHGQVDKNALDQKELLQMGTIRILKVQVRILGAFYMNCKNYSFSCFLMHDLILGPKET